MNHKWIENKSFKPHDGFTKEFDCSMCGCKKTKHIKGFNYYERSGITFGITNVPECLDWNDNTLD